ncbi:MAG: YafY family protein [Myxococcota bacterium]
MLSTSARLLRLLTLLQSQRAWGGAELADRLEVTPRTLRRDVDRLRALGYPVDGQAGTAGGYTLGAGAHLPPLSLDDDEAVAVSVALRTATNTLSASMGEAALRALTKLERVFPSRLERSAQALRDSILILERSGPPLDQAILAMLARACDARRLVQFDYTSKSSNRTRRTVEPARLVHTGRWYLVAFDRDRDDWRTFRVDRMGAEPTLGEVFSNRPLPEGGDLRAFVARSISMGPYSHSVVVILHAPLERLAARLLPATALVERLAAHRTKVSIGASSMAGLAAWVASFEVDFEVVEPPELVRVLHDLRLRVDGALRAATNQGNESRGHPARTSFGVKTEHARSD